MRSKCLPISVNPGESGQAILEYILLLAMIVGLSSLVFRGLRQMNLAGIMMGPMRGSFAKAYQSGDPRARGIDNPNGAYRHPRDTRGEESFRMFTIKGSTP